MRKLVIKSQSSPESTAIIRDFIDSQYTGTLATADANGAPHAATVYFSVDDDFCITFATKSKTRKYKDIEENKHVSFACSDEATQTTVQIEGKVEKVTDADKLQAAVNRMYYLSETRSRNELPPVEKVFAGDYVALRIIPQVIKMGIFLRPDSESNEEIYETLTFASES